MVRKGIQHHGFHRDDIAYSDFAPRESGECGGFDGCPIMNFQCDVKCRDGRKLIDIICDSVGS